MKNKFVVYTGLFGDYDDLIDPKEKYVGCDFICFTDQEHLKSDIWEIRLVKECDMPPNMMNRKYKILPHLFLSEYEWSLYIDTNILIKSNPLNLVNFFLNKHNIAIPKHFSRNCIYEEINAVLESKKIKYEQYKYINNKLLRDGFPKKYGLTENNIIFRKHNINEIINLMEQWWHYLNKYVQRDQLTFMYLVWKNNILLNMIDINARGNNYFRIKPHIYENINCKFNTIYIKLLEFIYNNPKILKAQFFFTIYKKICRGLF